jgi:hypothetical protein
MRVFLGSLPDQLVRYGFACNVSGRRDMFLRVDVVDFRPSCQDRWLVFGKKEKLVCPTG